MLTGVLRTEKGAAAARMQEKFRMTDLTARGVDGRPVYSYMNAQGKPNTRGTSVRDQSPSHDHPSPCLASYQPLSCPTLCTRDWHVH